MTRAPKSVAAKLDRRARKWWIRDDKPDAVDLRVSTPLNAFPARHVRLGRASLRLPRRREGIPSDTEQAHPDPSSDDASSRVRSQSKPGPDAPDYKGGDSHQLSCQSPYLLT